MTQVSTTPRQQGRSKLPSDNGPDGIVSTGWSDDEPEQDVCHVDDPDGLVTVRVNIMKPNKERRRTP